MMSIPSDMGMTSKTSSEQWFPKEKRSGWVRVLPLFSNSLPDASKAGMATCLVRWRMLSAFTIRSEIAKVVLPQSRRVRAGTSRVLFSWSFQVRKKRYLGRSPWITSACSRRFFKAVSLGDGERDRFMMNSLSTLFWPQRVVYEIFVPVFMWEGLGG